MIWEVERVALGGYLKDYGKSIASKAAAISQQEVTTARGDIFTHLVRQGKNCKAPFRLSAALTRWMIQTPDRSEKARTSGR